MDQINSVGPASSAGIGKVLHILWRRSWVVLLVMGLALGTTYIVSNNMQERYRGSQQLQLLQRMPVLVTSTQGARNAPTVESVEMQVALLNNPSMAFNVVNYMKNNSGKFSIPRDAMDRLDVEALRKSVTVTGAKETNLIQIEVEADSRAKVSDYLKAYSETFIDMKTKKAETTKLATRDNLKSKTDAARKRMYKAEQDETAFKQSHRLANPSMQQDAIVKQFVDRDADVSLATQEQLAADSRLKALETRLKDANAAIKAGEAVRDDSLVLSLQSQLSQAEIERSQAAQRFTPEYPGVLPELDAKIADIKARLTKAVQGTLDNKRPSLGAQEKLFEEYKAAQTAAIISASKVKSSTAWRDALSRETAGIPQASLTYARLARESELAKSLYQQYQSALNAVEVDTEAAVANIQLASDAYVPQEPYSPDHRRNLAFGAIIGLFLSLVSILLLEQSDDRVRDTEGARRIAPGPVVGALPKLSRRQLDSLMSGKLEMNAIEAYSLARANLSLVHRRNTHGSLWNKQVVLITSAVPGEGKSLTAFHMARSMARAGRQVILVDADMRRPSQNYLFNTDEPSGLANVLSGEMELSDALVSSDVENLLVLYSGTIHQNPTDLVSTERMIETIDALREESDVVIIDTPACSVVADALLMAPYADCILHIIGAGQVGENVVCEAAAALQAASPKTLAFFVNRAPKEKRTAYANYYYATPEPRQPALLGLPPGTGSADHSHDA